MTKCISYNRKVYSISTSTSSIKSLNINNAIIGALQSFKTYRIVHVVARDVIEEILIYLNYS